MSSDNPSESEQDDLQSIPEEQQNVPTEEAGELYEQISSADSGDNEHRRREHFDHAAIDPPGRTYLDDGTFSR